MSNTVEHNSSGIDQRLLELVYGLVPDDEAAGLRRRIATEPAVARAFEHAQRLAGLLSEASRLEPSSQPLVVGEAPAGASRSRLPANHAAPMHRSRSAPSVSSPMTSSRGGLGRIAVVLASACVLAFAVLFVAPSGEDPDAAVVADSAFPAEPSEWDLLVALPKPPVSEPHVPAIGETLRTGDRERRRVPLGDGSVVYLNENTSVEVESERRLRVAAGEVFVDVAPRADAAERFVVATPERDVVALGTKFIVTTDDDRAAPRLAVVQGRVRTEDFAQAVAAGQQLVAAAPAAGADVGDALTLAPAIRSSELLAWTRDLRSSSRPKLVPDSPHAGGALVAIDPQGQETQLSLRRYHVDVHIEDGFARTTIDQTYFNHEQQQLEGTFYFPLPADASLSRLAMYVAGLKMEGGMVERDYARNVFEEIRYARRDPALLEWVDGSTFKMRVFPLEARHEKRLLLSYTQRLPAAYGRTTYRFPAGHNLEVAGAFSTEIRLKDGADLKWRSPSHELKARTDGNDLVLETHSRRTAIDRDIVLEVESRASRVEGRKGAATGDSASARISSYVDDGQRYLLLRMEPELAGDLVRPRRDFTILFEATGDRDPLLARVQIDAVQTILEHAEHGDTFALIVAGTTARPFADEPLHCTPDNIAGAVAFLEQTHLIGALDLEAALAACSPFVAAAESPYLVHIGSGVPILGSRRIDELAQRVATLGEAQSTKHKDHSSPTYVGVPVGHRWSREFVENAARLTGGLVWPINPDEDVAWKAFELVSTLNAPRLVNLRVADDTSRTHYLTFAAQIAQGEELCAVARFPENEPLPKSLVVTGELVGAGDTDPLSRSRLPGGTKRSTGPDPATGPARQAGPAAKPWKQTIELTDARIADGAAYLPRFWARLEIDRLLADDAVQHKPQIVELSKAMYVMSPYTSLLVLESEAMYEQYKVDRGRSDHWAMYPAPERIPVVHQPLTPSLVDTKTQQSEPVRAPTPAEIEHRQFVQRFRDLRDSVVVRPTPVGPSETTVPEDVWRELTRNRRKWASVPVDAELSAVESLSQVDPREAAIKLRALQAKAEQLEGISSLDRIFATMRLEDAWRGVEERFVRINNQLRGVDPQDKFARFFGEFPPAIEPELAQMEFYAGRNLISDELLRRRVLDTNLESDMGSAIQDIQADSWSAPAGAPMDLERLKQNLLMLRTDGSRPSDLLARIDLATGQVRAEFSEMERLGKLVAERHSAVERQLGLGRERVRERLQELETAQRRAGARAQRSVRPELHAERSQLRQTIRALREWQAFERVPSSTGDRDGVAEALFGVQQDNQHRLAYEHDLSGFASPQALWGTTSVDGGRNWWATNGGDLGWRSWDVPGQQWVDLDFDRPISGSSLTRMLAIPMYRGLSASTGATPPGIHNGNQNFHSYFDQSGAFPLADAVEFGFIRPDLLVEDLIATSSRVPIQVLPSLDAANTDWLRPDVSVEVAPHSDTLTLRGNFNADAFFKRAVRPLLGTRAYPVGDLVLPLIATPTASVRFFSDLVAHAPGLNTTWMDIAGVLDEELPPSGTATGRTPGDESSSATIGTIDPDARMLIEQVPAQGWEAVTLPTGDGDAELTIIHDGRGRFVYEQAVSEGLREHVVCDGDTLLHLYPEIGLGARRTVSRFHRAEFESLIPWIVPSLEDLARGADVRLVGERTIAVVPRAVSDTDADSEPLDIHLVIDADGRLGERRLVESSDGAVVFRWTYAADGTVRLLDSDDQVITELSYRRRSAAAPDLQPDLSELVVLPLPYRSEAWLAQHAPLPDDPTAQADSAADARLAHIAAAFAADAPGRLRAVIDREFFQRGDRRPGFYTLLTSTSARWVADAETSEALRTLTLDIDARQKDTPLGDYLRESVRFALNAGGSPPPAAQLPASFLSRMAEARYVYALWTSANPAVQQRRAAAEEQSRAIDAIRRSRSDRLAWLLLHTVASHGQQAVLDSVFLGKLADVAVRFDGRPGFSVAARLARASWLEQAGRTDEARELLRDLYMSSLDRGVLPPVDAQFVTAVRETAETRRRWRERLRELHALSLDAGERSAALRLAFEAHRMQDAALADTLLDRTLTGISSVDDPGFALSAAVGLMSVGQFDRADTLLRPLLDDERFRTIPELWRQAATAAHGQRDPATAITRLDRAYDLEYERLPEVVDLAAFRSEYERLFHSYREAAAAARGDGASLPDDFTARVLRAADRWRQIDPDDTAACHAAAGVFNALGQAELAWAYLTTPLSQRPNEAEPWTQLAAQLQSTGDADRAADAYATAFELEPTNAQILWDHAQLVESARDFESARPLYQRLAEGSWQPRFQALQGQARARLAE